MGNNVTTNKQLKSAKGADLQKEQGAELSKKYRLKGKSGESLGSTQLAEFSKKMRVQKKYRKYIVKPKQDKLQAVAESPKTEEAPTKTEALTTSVQPTTHYTPKSAKLQEKSTPTKPIADNFQESRWNNPEFAQKPKSAKSANEKPIVTDKNIEISRQAPKRSSKRRTYISKLIQAPIHHKIHKEIEESDNEALKAIHWAEQKVEDAAFQGVSKLSPVAIHRQGKSTSGRRESKLQAKKSKEVQKQDLRKDRQTKSSESKQSVQSAKKKNNTPTRTQQKRKIKRDYQKAMAAAKGKTGGGTLSQITREISKGNPRGVNAIIAKKAAVFAAKVTAKITIFNPLFWKLLLAALLLFVIIAAVHACVSMFSGGIAGVGFVGDEDIEHSTRIYSEWEVDLEIYLNSGNIEAVHRPPAHITSQSGATGVVVYPPPPHTPPPPFYEYRLEIGMISHDPMELISYLTAAHGSRFDPESDNPMTRNDLNTILAEIFKVQYGVPPGDFSNLIHEEVETRFRRERHEGEEGEAAAYQDIHYEFWILTVRLEPRSLSEVLRSRMTLEQQNHFDALVLTGNGRQVVGNPFNFNWLPRISSHYGYRIHPIDNVKRLHTGIDISAPIGTPLFATHSGVITEVQFSNTGYGNMLRLTGLGRDGTEITTLFAHLDEIHAARGQEVSEGEVIATVGNTGASTGPHLHLEVFRQNPAMRLNPLFAVITWTDDEGNENFRPLPGENN